MTTRKPPESKRIKQAEKKNSAKKEKPKNVIFICNGNYLISFYIFS